MTTPNVIASACLGRASSCRGANQITTGTTTQRTLPQTTTDIGGRSSNAAAGALSAMVSVVKQPCLAEDIVENFLAPRIQRDQRQPDLRRREETEPGHHVLERNRIRVEEDRLRQREQFEVQPARVIPFPA